MRRLILVRHSESRASPEVPAAEWPLSAAGRDRCRDLARQLEPYKPEQVITSTERKAIETGSLVAERLAVDCSTFPGLHEHMRTGEPFERSHDLFQQRVAHFFRQPEQKVYGLESAADCLARFSQTLERVLAEHDTGNLVIVTHGTVLSLYIAAREGVDAYSIWQRLEMPAYAVFDVPAGRLIELHYSVTESTAGSL